ncbi:MAG: HDOD domain-containing protein [Candidatus Omnitrophota bacterium]
MRRLELLQRIEALPPISTVLQLAVRDLRCSGRMEPDVMKALRSEPELTDKIFKLANCGYFTDAAEIQSLTALVETLNENRALELVVCTSVFDWLLSAVQGGEIIPWDLCNHSFAVAAGAELLAEEMKIPAPKYAYLCGFLHDIGKILLEKRFEVDPKPILDLSCDESISVDEAERRMLGIDHMEVGSIVLQQWKMPSLIVDVVRWHHLPELYTRGDTLLVDLVHAADATALQMGVGPESEGLNYWASMAAETRLKLNVHIVEKVIFRIQSALESMKEFLAPAEGKGCDVS